MINTTLLSPRIKAFMNISGYTVDYFNQERNTDIFLPGGLGAVLALRASHDVNRPVTRRVGREAAVLAASIASAALPASYTAAMPASSAASSLAA